jgi:hypothetical protein
MRLACKFLEAVTGLVAGFSSVPRVWIVLKSYYFSMGEPGTIILRFVDDNGLDYSRFRQSLPEKGLAPLVGLVTIVLNRVEVPLLTAAEFTGCLLRAALLA